ncbi:MULTISPECIES: phosphoribosylamine--glycine ligase [unclassified Ruminococcus]|uniref:phosphoribosylamine--glycine ligase n=1 Tax=unclassified Ruminococcus TaxID=2608920 RepID=UPI00210CDC4B|nr:MULTISPECIES: phosphoribosylamine--glycine ligase [unclassified Ruminococcus]MCQ4022721.1 phosphoribosylamine--glycine ligase [Ruminococcus sp. zg-924]MCQ4114961.1 phosphoribosylamine--glycine ligase [Ruminococcus sp. zg-921]
MNVLMIGSGGREHALIKAILKSPRLEKLYCAPGNGGISRDALCVDIPVMDKVKMIEFAKENNIDLAFVAPDDPLADGMVDAFEAAGIRAFGPNARAAVIEASKVFSKNLMKKYGIPTAEYEVFDNSKDALAYVKDNNIAPVVVKADGLALGKGVIIAQTVEEAEKAILTIMEDKKFGESGNKVVIEEFLTGPEVSVLSFTDGKTVKPMVSSKDHKRALDGDKGLNTGGMGTISPNPYYTDELAQKCMETIFKPTIAAMEKEGRAFKGCLYFGLMMTPKGPKVIEYNARFGDPEAQVVLPRLKTDILDIIDAVIDERLDEIDIEWSDECSACVVMASGGYPESYKKGIEMFGMDANGQVEGATVYHAGTKYSDGKFYTNGGRVLGVTATGKTLDEALEKAYEAVGKISFDGAHYRKDIGRTK